MSPLTTGFMSAMSMGVMADGSTTGCGLCGEFAPASDPTRLVHCLGSPTNLLFEESKPVCTRCWKLEGAEISTFFFFFANILFQGDLGSEINFLFSFLFFLSHFCKGPKDHISQFLHRR
jgi:hypothetical protein